jgi:hypothetical protein
MEVPLDQLLRALNASFRTDRFTVSITNALIDQTQAFIAACGNVAAKPQRRREDLVTYAMK